MKARELMTKDPQTVTPKDSLQRAASLMGERDVGAIPVVSDDGSRRLVGIVTDRDITLKHVAKGHTGECTVDEVMTSGELATVTEDDDVDRVMELMQRHKVRRVPVLRDEQIVGMIAQADLALQARDDRRVEETVERISEPGR